MRLSSLVNRAACLKGN